MEKEPNALQLKVKIAGIEPAIWRRLVFPIHWNLHQLHLGIQAAFNWENSHLHEFRIGPLVYGDVSGEIEPGERDLDERSVSLANLDTAPNSSFVYLYDFGDLWYHVVDTEKALSLELDPRHGLCTGGARACPPEDIGSTEGYERFLLEIGDKNHEDHQSALDWFGGPFDPEYFDMDRCNKDLQNALRSNVKRRREQPRPDKLSGS